MKASKVQTLRGLACCLLLLYHVIGATASQGLRVQDGWLRQFTEALVVVRMPVFGLIAGAMHGLSSKRAWALVQHKAARLLLPMLSVGTLFALVQYAIPGSNFHTQDLWLLHIVPVAHYWFLESLFLIFCLMALMESVLPVCSFRTCFVIFLFHAFFTSATRRALQALVPGSQWLVLVVSLPLGVLAPIGLQWLISRSQICSGLLLGTPQPHRACA